MGPSRNRLSCRADAWTAYRPAPRRQIHGPDCLTQRRVAEDHLHGLGEIGDGHEMAREGDIRDRVGLQAADVRHHRRPHGVGSTGAPHSGEQLGMRGHQLPIDHRDIGTGVPQRPDHPSSGQGHRQVAMPPCAALEGQIGCQTSGDRRVERPCRAVEQERVITKDVQPQQRPRTGTAGAEPGDGATSCSEAGHGEVREEYSLDRGAAEETLSRVLTDHGGGDHGIGVRDLRRGTPGIQHERMPRSGHRPVHAEEGALFELRIGFYPEDNWHHSASIALRPWPLARLPEVGGVRPASGYRVEPRGLEPLTPTLRGRLGAC